MSFNSETLMYIIPLGLIILFIIILIMISSIIKHSIFTDEKTSLYNGVAFKRKYKRLVKRYTNHYLFFAQIDQLDTIAHLYGITFYDHIVEQFAFALETFFKSKVIFYLGSAKFIVIISEETKTAYSDDALIKFLNDTMAIKYYQKVLRYRFSQTALSAKKNYKKTLKELYLAANIYQETKLNQCITFHDNLETDQIKVHRIVETLISVSDNPALNNLWLHYQPLINAKTGEIEGIEVLSRLKVDTFGLISPDEFIPIAERYGIIQSLGKVIFKKSLADFKRFLKENDTLYISINLSPLELKDPEFYHYLDQVVKDFGLKPSQIHLEITETAFAKDYHTFIDTVKALNKLGFTFYLDDFGVGYSSFQYMIDAQISGVKLDRYFTEKISSNVGYDMFSQGLAFMIKGLNASLTIEGIETKKQADYFKRLGADSLQGFLFSKPLPFEDMIKKIRKIS